MTNYRPPAEATGEPREFLAWLAGQGIRLVTIGFYDLFNTGVWQAETVTVKYLMENMDKFRKGIEFDGSSIAGWRKINESDMLIVPELDTAFIDPFASPATAFVIGHIVTPDGRVYEMDPRNVASRALEHMARTGIADHASFGPELEGFLFDNVEVGEQVHFISEEEPTSNGNGRLSISHHVRKKGGYFPWGPVDKTYGDRATAALVMEELGILVERFHHEVARAGQFEINFKHGGLLETADRVMLYKYVVKKTAEQRGKTATFMPKPIADDNGSGMHVHFSLWKGGKPLFAGEPGSYAGLSQTGKYAIGGILAHARALSALVAWTTNSYKRLVPGFEAPVNIAYSMSNRSAGVRIPNYYPGNPSAVRMEIRFPDPTCNFQLAGAAILMAALDGIAKKTDPGDPVTVDIYEHKDLGIPQLPGSLAEAMDALQQDCEFLLQGGVFTKEILEKIIMQKAAEAVEIGIEADRAKYPGASPKEIEYYFAC